MFKGTFKSYRKCAKYEKVSHVIHNEPVRDESENSITEFIVFERMDFGNNRGIGDRTNRSTGIGPKVERWTHTRKVSQCGITRLKV